MTRDATVFKLHLVMLPMVFLATSCRQEAGGVLLRYTPQVGKTYRYRLEIQRPHDSPMGALFPIVDDYGGFHKFGYLRGRTLYQTRYGSDGVAWTLTLVD